MRLRGAGLVCKSKCSIPEVPSWRLPPDRRFLASAALKHFIALSMHALLVV